MQMKQIDKFIRQIKGKKMSLIGRTSGLVWIGFGDLKEQLDSTGKVREISSFMLHIQCLWRLIQKQKIIVASGDLFLPNNQNFNEGEFIWESIGANLFDVKSKELTEKDFAELYVNDVKLNDIGDLNIILSNDYKLQLFIDTSTSEECWRLFKPYTCEFHIISYGNKIAIE